MSAPSSNWDGHEFDPNGKLKELVDKRRKVERVLAEEIVADVEAALEEACDSKTTGYSRATFIEGSLDDFTRIAAAATIEAFIRQAPMMVDFRQLAQAIRDVPALKAV